MMDGIEWLANELGRMKWPKELDQLDAEVIIALADCNMNANEAARRIYVHRNTIVYHGKKISKFTGKDIMNFYDLCELVLAAKKYLAGM